MNTYVKPQIKIKQLSADTEFLAASGEIDFSQDNSSGSTPISNDPYTGGGSQNLSKRNSVWETED